MKEGQKDAMPKQILHLCDVSKRNCFCILQKKIGHATGKKGFLLLPDHETGSVVARDTYYLSSAVACAILFAIHPYT